MSLDYEIWPDPEPDEAAALIVALEQAISEDRAFAEPAVGSSAWRRAGLDEAFE